MDPFITNVQLHALVAKKNLAQPIAPSVDHSIGFSKPNQRFVKLFKAMIPRNHKLIGIAALGVPMFFKLAVKLVNRFKHGRHTREHESSHAAINGEAVPPTTASVLASTDNIAESNSIRISPKTTDEMKFSPLFCAADKANNSASKRLPPEEAQKPRSRKDISVSSAPETYPFSSTENDSEQLLVRALSQKILMQITSSEELPNVFIPSSNDIKSVSDINSTEETLSPNRSNLKYVSIRRRKKKQLQRPITAPHPESVKKSYGRHITKQATQNITGKQQKFLTDTSSGGPSRKGSSNVHHVRYDPPRMDSSKKGKKKPFPQAIRAVPGSGKYNGN